MAINFSNTTPSIPTGGSGVLWQTDGAGNLSGYITTAPIAASISLTAQAAAISATTLLAVGAGGAGTYQISYVATVTQAATSSSTLGGSNGFQIVYTNLSDSVSKTTPAGATSATNTTAVSISGVVIANVLASTTIQYQFGYTSSGVTVMQYDLNIRVVLL